MRPMLTLHVDAHSHDHVHNVRFPIRSVIHCFLEQLVVVPTEGSKTRSPTDSLLQPNISAECCESGFLVVFPCCLSKNGVIMQVSVRCISSM